MDFLWLTHFVTSDIGSCCLCSVVSQSWSNGYLQFLPKNSLIIIGFVLDRCNLKIMCYFRNYEELSGGNCFLCFVYILILTCFYQTFKKKHCQCSKYSDDDLLTIKNIPLILMNKLFPCNVKTCKCIIITAFVWSLSTVDRNKIGSIF